jgi:hypothetical protein
MGQFGIVHFAGEAATIAAGWLCVDATRAVGRHRRDPKPKPQGKKQPPPGKARKTIRRKERVISSWMVRRQDHSCFGCGGWRPLAAPDGSLPDFPPSVTNNPGIEGSEISAGFMEI